MWGVWGGGGGCLHLSNQNAQIVETINVNAVPTERQGRHEPQLHQASLHGTNLQLQGEKKVVVNRGVNLYASQP